MSRLQRVPPELRAGIVALLLTLGVGYYAADDGVERMQQNEYVQAVAADASTSTAVKVAMVMGSYYESSYRHIGTPYIDKAGKGQPLTVCNGITGAVAHIDARHEYSPAECYQMERGVYIANARYLRADVPRWAALTPLQQAVFVDFAHNKGQAAWHTSTMRRLLLAGDVAGACQQNERWTRGTVAGISRVLPGLVTRANANADLCAGALP